MLAGVHLELGGHGPQQVVLAPQGRGLQHRLNVLTLQKKKETRSIFFKKNQKLFKKCYSDFTLIFVSLS